MKLPSYVELQTLERSRRRSLLEAWATVLRDERSLLFASNAPSLLKRRRLDSNRRRLQLIYDRASSMHIDVGQNDLMDDRMLLARAKTAFRPDHGTADGHAYIRWDGLYRTAHVSNGRGIDAVYRLTATGCVRLVKHSRSSTAELIEKIRNASSRQGEVIDDDDDLDTGTCWPNAA